MRLRVALVTIVVLGLAGCGSQGDGGAPERQNFVHSIVILPGNHEALYLGTRYRLYVSRDGGATWRSLLNHAITSMAVDSHHPSTMYAVSLKVGVLKTVDGGRHWRPCAHTLKGGLVRAVVLNSATGTVLASGAGIYRSADAGMHWSSVLPNRPIANITIGAENSDYASSLVDGMYISHDDGRRWTHVRGIGNQPVIQVLASKTSVYAVTGLGVYRSRDAGSTWTLLASAPPGVEFLGVSQADPNEVFGEIGGHGFVVSRDGGATWRTASQGLHDKNFTGSAIEISPSSPKVVYTGSWGLAFYASHDGGRHWVKRANLTG
ncbi:MAG: hypothetical protein PVSMB7_14160 [Chloroflexota bacterium]